MTDRHDAPKEPRNLAELFASWGETHFLNPNEPRAFTKLAARYADLLQLIHRQEAALRNEYGRGLEDSVRFIEDNLGPHKAGTRQFLVQGLRALKADHAAQNAAPRYTYHADGRPVLENDPPPVAAPDGVVVPREPTSEMLAASWANADPSFIHTDHEYHIADAYRAMLAAAPAAQPNAELVKEIQAELSRLAVGHPAWPILSKCADALSVRGSE